MTDVTFNEYQIQARSTAIYPATYVDDLEEHVTNPCALMYPALGLAGEAGEVAEKVKKIIRDNRGTVGPTTTAALAKELGDVLWYVAAIASELELDLGDIAQGNLDKLFKRRAADKLTGSGDER